MPQLADEVPVGLSERQLIERHSKDEACAKCHSRIDPFGFALEHYDAIGRRRQKSGGGIAIDSKTTLPDGTKIDGIDGLRGYLLKQRIADVRTFTADLRRVARGGTALDPDVVEIMVARARLLGGGVEALTPRQREVLALMAQGRSNGWIAAELGLSEKAIVQHTSNIYDMLGLAVDADDHRRVLAVIHYLTH